MPYTRLCLTMLDHAVPEVAGWVGSLESLPKAAQEWIKRAEEDAGVPVALVGTGPDTVAGSWS
jgi:adenylosuccinate synthase